MGEENLFMEVRLFECLPAHLFTTVVIEPFEDEIHPRLRLPHRGIVAMANNGTKNSNDSQFIITLGTLPFSVAVSVAQTEIST